MIWERWYVLSSCLPRFSCATLATIPVGALIGLHTVYLETDNEDTTAHWDSALIAGGKWSHVPDIAEMTRRKDIRR